MSPNQQSTIVNTQSLERWLPIPSCPGYFASDHGRIRRGATLVNPWINTATGRLQCHIRKSGYGTSAMVSRLIGEVFCPDFKPSLWSDFKDGNRLNCRPDNLEWAPPSKLSIPPIGSKQGRSKLTEDQVLRIRSMAATTTFAELAATFAVSKVTIHNIVRRQTWSHLAA